MYGRSGDGATTCGSVGALSTGDTLSEHALQLAIRQRARRRVDVCSQSTLIRVSALSLKDIQGDRGSRGERDIKVKEAA